MSNLIVVGDADAIIAQVNSKDLLHKRAVKISKVLVEKNARLIYPLSAVIESVTYVQRVLDNKKAASAIAEEFKKRRGIIVPLNKEIYSLAVSEYFNGHASKKDTLFDCIVAATAEKLQADYIFSFDKFYKKQGFSLAKSVTVE